MRLLTLLGLSVVLTSCAAGSSEYYTQSVQSWRGGNANDLVKVWGTPYNMMTGSSGTTVYIYKRQSFVSTNANYSPSIGVHTRDGGIPVVTSTPNMNSSWNRGFAAYCLAMFTASPSGKIIDTNIQGTNCYISQSAAAQLANPKGKAS